MSAFDWAAGKCRELAVRWEKDASSRGFIVTDSDLMDECRGHAEELRELADEIQAGPNPPKATE